MFGAPRPLKDVYDTILDSSTQRSDNFLFFLVWMQFDKISILLKLFYLGQCQESIYRGHLQSREYLLLAVNNAPSPQPVVNEMTQRE